MSAPQAHPTELLLDFAYQELDPAESRRIEAHLSSCPDCTRELEGIRGVRKAMAPLSPEPPPDAGLESLLAYAEKSARSRREGRPRRTWLVGWVGLAATAGLVVVLGQQARQSLPEADAVSTGAGGPIAYQKRLSAPARSQFGARDEKEEAPAPPPPPPLAQRRGAADLGAKKAKAKAAPGPLAEKLQKDRAEAGELAPEGKSMPASERKMAKREQASRAEHPKKRSREVAVAEAPAEREGVSDNAFDSAFGASKGAGLGGGVAQRASKPNRTRAAAPAARPASAAPMAAASGAAAPGPATAPATAPATERADTASQDPRRAELSRLEAALPHLIGEARARALEQICALQQALGQDTKARSTLQLLLRDFPNSEEAARAKRRMALPASPRGE